MRNIKLILSYDGTDFHGWHASRAQDHSANARGCHPWADPGAADGDRRAAAGPTRASTCWGRSISSPRPRHRPEIILKALNGGSAASDLRVLEVRDMPQAFHATLDAISKRYRYVIDDGPIASPFHLRYSCRLRRLNIEAMVAAYSWGVTISEASD